MDEDGRQVLSAATVNDKHGDEVEILPSGKILLDVDGVEHTWKDVTKASSDVTLRITLDPKIAETLDETGTSILSTSCFLQTAISERWGCMDTTNMGNSLPVGWLKAKEKTVRRTGVRSTAFGFEQRTSNAKPSRWINFLPTRIQC